MRPCCRSRLATPRSSGSAATSALALQQSCHFLEPMLERAQGHSLPFGREALAERGGDTRQSFAVIANPPWGQKAVEAGPAPKRYLWRRFPSSAGIFDWFRPFVELASNIANERS